MSEQDQANTCQEQPEATPSLPQEPRSDGAIQYNSESEDEDWSDDSVPFFDVRANGLPGGKPGQATEPEKTKRRHSFLAYPFRQHRRDNSSGLDGHPSPLLTPRLIKDGSGRASILEGTQSRLSGSGRRLPQSTPSTSGAYYGGDSFERPPFPYAPSTPFPYMYTAPSSPTMIPFPPLSPGMAGVYVPPLQQYYGPPDHSYHSMHMTNYPPPPYPKYPNPNAELPSRLVPESRSPRRRGRGSPDGQRRDAGRRRQRHQTREAQRDPGNSGDLVGRVHPSERNVETARAYLQKRDAEREREQERGRRQRAEYNHEKDFVQRHHEADRPLHTPHPDNVVIIRGSYDIDRPENLHTNQDIGAGAMLQQVLQRIERLELTVATHPTLRDDQTTNAETAGVHHGDNPPNPARIPVKQNTAHIRHAHHVPPDRIDRRGAGTCHDPTQFHNAELESIEIEPNINSAKRRSSGKRLGREVKARSQSPAAAPSIMMMTPSTSYPKRKSPKPQGRPPPHSSSRKTAAYFEEVSDEDDDFPRNYTFKPGPPRPQTRARASKDELRPPTNNKLSKEEEYDSIDDGLLARRVPRKASSPPKEQHRGSTVGHMHSKKTRVDELVYPEVPPAVPDVPPL